MDLEQRISLQFAAHMETVGEAAASMSLPLVRASERMVNGLLQGSKIITCGNGGNAALAQYFTARLVYPFQRERPGLPAICLSDMGATLGAFGKGQGFELAFAKQLEALGQPGDILLAITTSGDSTNIAEAFRAAAERQMQIVLLSGCGGGRLGGMLGEQDVPILVPSCDPARTQEIHLLGIHCLCDLIDTRLLGG